MNQMIDKVRKSLDGALQRSKKRQRIYGRVGKRLPNGEYTFKVVDRPDCIWVTIRLSSGGQGVVSAVNTANVPHRPNLAVELEKEGADEDYVIVRKSPKRLVANPIASDPSGNEPHLHDHGSMDGLEDDDHEQYYNAERLPEGIADALSTAPEKLTIHDDDKFLGLDTEETGEPVTWWKWSTIATIFRTWLLSLPNTWAAAQTFTLKITGAAGADITGLTRIYFDANSHFDLVPNASTLFQLNHEVASGASLIDINPKPADGASSATFRFFRSTNTSGAVGFQITRGNNTTLINSFLGGNTSSYFNSLVGFFGVGTASPQSIFHVRDHSGANGSWMFNSKANVDSVSQTIEPNTTGDITVGVMFDFIATDGTDIVFVSNVTMLVNTTYSFVLGSGTYTFTVASTGAMTVARSNGSGTMTKLAIRLMWL